MNMKKHLLPLIWGLAGVFAIATAFGTGDEPLEEPEDDGVVLGEEDLAERGEILRNQFRRMTPGDEPLVQDIGTWPAAWEEFGTNWDSAAADREYGAWVVPVELTQENGATVMKDGDGNELWRGTTGFARPESADVVLTGGLVAEEEWPVYEAVRGAVEEMTADASRVDEPRDAPSEPETGLRFTAHEWTASNTFRVEMAYEVDTNVDLFVYAVAHTSAWVEAAWTNDENMVITNSTLVWYPVGAPYNGRDSTWEYLDTITIDNGEAEYEDSGFPDELGQSRFYALALSQDLDGDGLSDGQEAFIFHSDPMNTDSDGDGLDDGDEINVYGTNPENADTDDDGIDDLLEYASGSTPSISNVWWSMKTTNVLNDGEGYQYLGNQPSWSDYPICMTNLTITGIPPMSNAVPIGVTLWGLVDDAITIDTHSVPVTWTNGAITISNEDVTTLITNLPSRSFQIGLWDWPDLPNGGDNEIRLGMENEPFRIEWEWQVPIDIRMEPIWNDSAPPLDNPSGIILGSNAWFRVNLLPSGIVPEEKIVWESQNGNLVFVTTNTGSRLEVCATNMGDDCLSVEVQDTIGDFGLPPFHVKVMPLTVVTAKVGIVKQLTGTNSTLAVSGNYVTNAFATANKILLQAGLQIELGEIVEIQSDDDDNYWELASGTEPLTNLCASISNPGGLEVYFVHALIVDNQPADGLCTTNGIVIAAEGYARTLAHEIMHACGLRDIYDEAGSSLDSVTGYPNMERMPEDWGSYRSWDGHNLPQATIIRKLLMFGLQHPERVDIPRGEVYGAYYGYHFGMKEWRFDCVGVGLSAMTNTPVSH